MGAALLAPGFRTEPLWLDALALAPEAAEPALPETADVVIVGAGYTGLSAALTLARAGRDVVVLDAHEPGYGCSRRNGGQCGASLKPGLAGLTRRFGSARAIAMLGEARESLEHLAAFVAEEGIACDFARPGRFVGAHTPRHYERLARDLEARRRALGVEVWAVPRAEQRQEIGSDLYYGGGVYADHAAVQPARYHAGLRARAEAAGARVVADTPVTALARDGEAVVAATPRGRLRAHDAIVATNGYSVLTGALRPFRRRVIPIGSYMIATEPQPEALIRRLSPKGRVLNDTRRVVLYFRASPDGRRMVFGGRVALAETDPRVSAPRLHALMTEIFPELASARISHSWMGFIAYTFDHLPHVGAIDRIHYAMGYCGSGVAMATWLGRKAALKVLGAAEGRSAFDGLPFPTRPLYGGLPWFLAGAVAWYRLLDRLGV